ncbi:MAG: response regulator, partial [Merismopedia sp. SIO2A8]|nr:response regulator [Merismopedia sp. SIO2A8]
LGLAISQRLVQMMGGTIKVTSQLGQGSEFYFTIDLPIVNDWPSTSAANSTQLIIGYQAIAPAHGESHDDHDNDEVALTGNPTPYSILVIDDRQENRAVLFDLLKPIGFSILEAENGQDGLNILRNQQPDLVILDLFMPVMNGFDFLEYVRCSDTLCHQKVIVSSASVAQTDQEMALEHGGDRFIAKPINAQELFNAIADCLNLEWIYMTPDLLSPDHHDQ